MWFKPATTMLIRQLKRGELTIFLLATMLAVGSVFSLSGFGERLNVALVQKSSDFLAADRILSSAHPLPPSLLNQAKQLELSQASYLTFNSVMFYQDEMVLTNSKAITGSYPLRGELKVSNQPLTNQATDSQGVATFGPPQRGEVWVAPELLIKLKMQLGAIVAIGEAEFTVSGIITFEPDASFNLFNLAPRVLLNFEDVAATKIIQPGSRLNYNYLFSGSEQQLQQFYQTIKPQLQSNQNWQDINGERSPVAGALERANKFLLLASLLGIILGATAIHSTAYRYSERQLDTVALLKTFGTGSRTIKKIFMLQLAIITTLGIVSGLGAGYALQETAFALVNHYLPQSMPDNLPSISIYSILISIATGIVCTTMFSLSPMLRLFNVPVMRVIKRDLAPSALNRWFSGGIFGLAIFTLLLLYSRSISLSLITLSVAALVSILLTGLAALVIKLSSGSRFTATSPWHLAIASLQQRALQSSVQIASIATALMLMLIILLLRNELIDEWQQQIPSGSANHFLANVTPEQVKPIEQLMAQYDITTSDLYPIIRGRVSAINDQEIGQYDSESSDKNTDNRSGRQGFGRELSLTWRDSLPSKNPLIEGQWWQAQDTEHLVSIEAGVAKRLAIKLNDQLEILIGQQTISARVTSIRDVNWRSMAPNFFLILNRAALGDMPSTYISSFHLGQDQHPLLTRLLQDYPTVSIIKVNRIIKKLRQIIDQVSLALTYIMLLVICDRTLVLLVQVQVSYQQRHQDLVILRTLGASKKLLKRAIAIEFLIIGALAGIIATLTTEVALWLIQTYVIKMPWSPHPLLWLFTTLGASLVVALVGTKACHQLTKLSPSELIRNLS
ncbi:MAG: FtsX-like permease family protein [Gammaproteobacteria bacterium]|nr:FtsX-like permease family protein [Gammaproteobacteria bacterium]